MSHALRKKVWVLIDFLVPLPTIATVTIIIRNSSIVSKADATGKLRLRNGCQGGVSKTSLTSFCFHLLLVVMSWPNYFSFLLCSEVIKRSKW